VTITYTDQVDLSGCGGYTGLITRTWKATDDCGNTSTCQQIITVVDTTKPTITCPSDLVLECGDPLAPISYTNWLSSAVAFDNCDASVTITTDAPPFDQLPKDCKKDRNTGTWVLFTATDDCGNVRKCNAKVWLLDTKDPVITCPDDVTIQCDESTDPSHTGWATATDTCDASLTITYTDQVDLSGCGGYTGVITRTWKAVDDCGHEATCQQIITIVDTKAPSITCPPNVTVQCDESTDPSHTGWATATDACDPSVTITYTDQVDLSGCGGYTGLITRTWKATDDCGNTSTCQQIITIVDTTKPTITCPPSYVCVCASQGLTATIPSYDWVAAKDNCDSDVTIVQSPLPGTIVGPGVHTIYITATDDCGNEATCQVTYEVKTGAIVVHKFHDRNANGSDDGQGEEPLAGWSFALYDAAGQLIRTGQTDQDGTITWNGLGCGNYTVVETLQAGWANSTPLSQQVTVGNPCGNGQAAQVRFGNYLLGKISGHKYEDPNGDGNLADGRPLSGWVIHLKGTDWWGGVVDRTTTTNGSGYYEFTGLKPGTYNLTEEIQPGWTQTKAPGAVVLAPEGVSENNDFGNFKCFTVRGHKWLDEDGDGVWDAGEPGIPGWKITLSGPGGVQAILSGPNNGLAQQNTVETDASGAYTFTVCLPGAYTVSEETRDSHLPTTPISVSFTAESGKDVVINFGNRSKLGGGGLLGFKFWDLNANRVWDAGEPTLAGWTIRIRNARGAIVYETTTLDAPNTPLHGGWFVDRPLDAGEYTVEEVRKDGWVQTYPAGGTYRIRVKGDGTYEVLDPAGYQGKLNFGNARRMGFKFHDVNDNGRYDPGEELLGRWVIRIYTYPGLVLVYENQTIAGDGWYLTKVLPEGDYVVTEVLQDGWVQTYPGGTIGHFRIHLYANGEYDLLGSSSAPWGLSFGNRRSAGGRCPDCPRWLVFQSDRSGNWDIYRSNLDGTDVRQLTEAPVSDIQPTWNFPGLEIAFATMRDGNWEIYRMNADGSGQINVTKYPTATDLAPSWSCSWIAFQTDRDGNWEIYKTDPDGLLQIRLTDNPAADQAPAWSPDGLWIAFESNRDGNWEIYVMDGEGGNVRRITDNAATDRNPDWSNDGQWIVFESNREGGQFDLYKVNVVTGELVRLTDDPASDTAAAWMPYCDWIFFQTNRDGNYEVYRMKTDGTDQRNLTRSPNTSDMLDYIP